MICQNILEAVGNTPIVRLNRMPEKDSAEILVKVESLNVGGSIKTRTALNMIEQAEKEGLIDQNSIIVEPTSGNQGIGLALIGAVKGYRTIIIMPDSVSEERRKLVRHYGAEVKLIHDTGDIGKCMEECLNAALSMKKSNPNVFVPQQFENPNNTLAHKKHTALEIMAQAARPIHGFCSGIGTGGTLTGIGEVLKAQTEIPKIDHVYSMWVPNGSGKHYASCLYCGNKIDVACEKVQLPIKSTSGAAVILCPVCGDCNGATATAVKGLKVGEGAPYRGTMRVWNIDAGDGNKYLTVSFDRFGKLMQPEGEVSVTLPAELKGATAGVIGADGNVKTVQESNGTLKLDFTGSQVVVLKGN